MTNKKEIFVYSQIQGEGFHPVAFELLNAARRLSENFGEKLKVSAVVCKNSLNEASKKALYEGGADKIYLVKAEGNHVKKAQGIFELCKIKEKEAEIFLIGATIEGRSIAPVISSKLETGLTADCTKLDITTFKDEKKLAATRPTFGGKLMATILCKERPQMATVRPSVLQKAETPYKEKGEFEEFTPNFEGFREDCIEILERKPNDNKFSNELENAKVIVAGGMGLKNKEGFKKLKKFAALINAPVAGSRKAVEKGFIEKEFQIGQTGKTVSPNVYIAFGISGAIHHIAGMENSKKIISINLDPNAPIFENSDIAITEDAQKVLDELISELEK